MRDIIILAHNIRSAHNVGSIFRTAEGFGVKKIILSGYTPYPVVPNDPRLPHISAKSTTQIAKTALGAEKLVDFEYSNNLFETIEHLRSQDYALTALEQAPNSLKLQDFNAPPRIAILIGEEVHGITPDLLSLADHIVEIPMFGHKESFNVSVATGIILYRLACE